jgi:hypothetical protein
MAAEVGGKVGAGVHRGRLRGSRRGERVGAIREAFSYAESHIRLDVKKYLLNKNVDANISFPNVPRER